MDSSLKSALYRKSSSEDWHGWSKDADNQAFLNKRFGITGGIENTFRAPLAPSRAFHNVSPTPVTVSGSIPGGWKPQNQSLTHSSLPGPTSSIVGPKMPLVPTKTVVQKGTGTAIANGKLYSQSEVASGIERFMAPQAHAGMHAPGLLGAAIGFGTAGYYAGNQDGWSAAQGIAGGYMAGKAANWAQSSLHSAATSMIRAETKSAEKMSETAFKAVNIGKMMTHSSNRGMIFAAGGLLGGALFSNMFAGNGSTYKRGFNANRGNSIQR